MQKEMVNNSEITNKRALNNYQRNFPLISRPFAKIGKDLGISENETLELFQTLKNKFSRIGPVFKPNTIGVSTLAAMQVSTERLSHVAQFISSLPEVNHNYEREHTINLWFVLTAPDSAKLHEVLKSIEIQTGIKVHDLRLEEEFRIDLGFDLDQKVEPLSLESVQDTPPSTMQKQIEFNKDFIEVLIPQIENGLAITQTPFRKIADVLDTTEDHILSALQSMLKLGQIRRFGVVVKHRELGFQSNAMVVWNIPDDTVSSLGRGIVSDPRFQFVSLCYKRQRSRPDWPYNFYFMIHGKSRESVHENLNFLIQEMLMQNFEHKVLFSTHCYKQKGARYSRFDKVENERLLLNILQEGIPVEDEPFNGISAKTGFTQQEILTHIEQWLKDGTLSRFGPMYNVEKFGGEFTLVAMQVPPDRFEEVNQLVNSFSEVAHNYEREHLLNMWFVLATSSTSETETILSAIEAQTGIKTFSLPKLEEYYLNLRFQA
jgi:DNA-binding Lrp family transcriptional regulator